MYIVNKGFSFVTARGLLVPGDEITEKDFEKKRNLFEKSQPGPDRCRKIERRA